MNTSCMIATVNAHVVGTATALYCMLCTVGTATCVSNAAALLGQAPH